MQPVKLLPLLLLVACPARANYVASGATDFVNAATTTCTPNSGGVTGGNAIVLGLQENSTTALTITSVPTTTWTLDQTQTQAGGTVTTRLYHGFAPSNAVLVITAAFNSGSGLIGVMCGEYDTRVFDTSASINGNGSLSVNITNSKAIADLVGFASSGVGNSSSIGAPFTQRQSISFSAQVFCTFGDQHVTTINTYPFNPAGSGTSTALVLALDGAIGTRHKSEIIQYHLPNNRSTIRTGGK